MTSEVYILNLTFKNERGMDLVSRKTDSVSGMQNSLNKERLGSLSFTYTDSLAK